jgi:hypothetical protein
MDMCSSREEFESHSPFEQMRATLFAFAKRMQAVQHATDEQLVSSARVQAVANISIADQLRQLVLVLPDQTMEQLLQRRVQAACDLQAHGEHASGPKGVFSGANDNVQQPQLQCRCGKQVGCTQ